MAPDAAFSNISDKNEFTKFTKFLAYKGVQVIVESRKGVKIEPNRKPMSLDTDWFNLQIPNTPEVNQATRNALPSDKILETIRSQLHVEISVQTEDGDEMVLELWTLKLDETKFDSSLKAMNTVYFRMGILLKSLISVTRITPAYHLSRKQRTGSFTIFYRVYNGVPKKEVLGDSVKKIHAGMLKTPLGAICFSVSYRTNFSISPNKTDKSRTLLLKSDHFELSPKHIIYQARKKKNQKEKKLSKPVDLNSSLRLAAFVDENIIKQVIKDFFTKMPIPKCRQSPSTPLQQDNTEELKATQELDVSNLSKSPTSLELPPKKFSGFRNENEPPLKLLHFAFADNHPIRELAEFYKEFFNAPHLKLSNDLCRSKSPESTKEVALVNKDLSTDLELYESSLLEFDELIVEMFKSVEWSGN